MTFSWDRNLARETIFAPADPRQLDWSLWNCLLTLAFVSHSMQSKNLPARAISTPSILYLTAARVGVWMGRCGDGHAGAGGGLHMRRGIHGGVGVGAKDALHEYGGEEELEEEKVQNEG